MTSIAQFVHSPTLSQPIGQKYPSAQTASITVSPYGASTSIPSGSTRIRGMAPA